jgi:hypothetical protein
MKRLLLLAFLATPVGAADLPIGTCINHADVVTAMKAIGASIYATGGLADGRKLEFWFDPKPRTDTYPNGNKWTPTIVARPTGVVTKTSCTIIFADSDPGVALPPP